MNQYLVSVIIPSYNRSFLLKEAIQSVVDQTYRPIECIVVDDGSTDDTPEIVREFVLKNNPQFTTRYIAQQNAGAQVARNTGTAASSGQYIQYLDSDDLLYPGKLQSQVSYLQDHPECDAVFGDWDEGLQGNAKRVIAYKKEDLVLQMLTERCISNFAILLRRRLLQKIEPWDVAIKRNQEIDFHLGSVMAGGLFEYQPFTTGLWRLHLDKRIGNTTGITETIAFFKKWENIIREKDFWNEDYASGITNNHIWSLGQSAGTENEFKLLLSEIYRHTPQHPIFRSTKFKISKIIFGLNGAVYLWIKRFKRNKTLHR